MFNNNKTINNLYNKINDYEHLKNKTYKKRENVYMHLGMIALVGLITIAGFLEFNILNIFLFLIFSLTLLLTSQGSKEIQNNNFTSDPLFYLWPKSEEMLKDKKQEMSQLLSKNEVQIEFFNFNFESVSETSINEFKKYLALKDYDNAYNSVREILKNFNNIEQQKIDEAQTKKLITEHELSLKFKL